MSADPAGFDPVLPETLEVASDQLRASTGVGRDEDPWDRDAPMIDGEVVSVTVDYDKVTGRTAPRIWTRPLRPLTRDATYGYRFIDWAADRGYPLDPFERWLAVHVGELLPDGRPRFRRVVIIVARQNGKTLFVKLLILFWAYEEAHFAILMTSTNLDYARAALFDASEMAGTASNTPTGARRMVGIPAPELRQANGQEVVSAPLRRTDPDDDESRLIGGGQFRIAASNRKGGRSLTFHRVIMDEVREHRDWNAYNAAIHTMNAVTNAQAFLISNKGDAGAVVLNGVRETALSGKDRRVGLFEWSCVDTDRPDDLLALRYANPNLGRRIDPETLLGEAITAMQEGGEALAQFKTEVMCIDVPNLDPAIDLDAWRECGGQGDDLTKLRARLACCLDVAPDGSHAMLVAAAVGADGVVRVEVVREWSSTRMLRRGLPSLLARVKPRVFGWFPDGPAAAVAADLAAPKQRRSASWPPPGVEVREIRAETPAVCMGFAELVSSRGLQHPMDELLTQHVTDAQRLDVGRRWVFASGDAGRPVCGAYAAAGATHLARLLPEPPRVRKLRTSS